ncbi:hypothetical protein quinque_014427 [Culex quinquefasciatus]
MSSLSKCFYEASAGKTCRDLWHPGFASCRHYIWDLWKRIMPGSFKLYIPLLVLPPLVKQDGVTGSYLVNHFLEYVYISIATYVQAALSLTFQCGFSNLFGYLNFWCVMFWPCLLGVLLGPRLPKQHLRLQGITFFNMVRLINPPSWNKPDHGRCGHKKSCHHNVLDGMLKYASVGLILESVRALITKFPLLMTNRSKFLTEFTKICSARLGLFLAFYVGIYRATFCLLNRHRLLEGPTQSTVAGFLAGSAYWLYPKYQVYTLAFTKAIEMSWEYWIKTGKKIPPVVEKFNRLPFVFLRRCCPLAILATSMPSIRSCRRRSTSRRWDFVRKI